MSPRARRLLAIGLSVAFIGTVWLAVLDPLLDWRRDAEASLVETAAVLARHRAVAARADEIAGEIAALRETAAREALFLPGDTAGKASAALQEAIKAAAAAANVRPDSVQALEASRDGELTRIAMRVRLSADTASLQKLLHALEGGRPVVLLDAVYVRARSFRSTATERNLDVRFDAVGFARTGGAG